MSTGPEASNHPRDAIERIVVGQTHRNIQDKLDRERAVIFPHDMIADIEARTFKRLGGDFRLRYDEPQGRIYIDRFDPTNIQVRMPNFSSDADPGFDKIEIVKRLWPRIPDVETAIRYTRHIADNYDRKNGKETLSLLSIHKAIRSLSLELQKPTAERVDWDELGGKVFETVIREGIDMARDKDKIAIGSEMLNAVSRDILGRENSSRSRLMLAHLYPRITKKLLRNENKYNKYRYLESVLYQERERDRAPLVELSSSIKRLASMDPRDREAVNLRRRLRLDANKNLAPIKIRVAPYVQIAAITRYLLFAKNIPEHEAKLAGYIGSDFASQIAEIGTLDLLPDEHRMPRLSAIADYIDASLQDADAQLPDLDKAA